MNKVYGYVDGKAVYSRDEFIFEQRGFGAIQNDNESLVLWRNVHERGCFQNGTIAQIGRV